MDGIKNKRRAKSDAKSLILSVLQEAVSQGGSIERALIEDFDPTETAEVRDEIEKIMERIAKG